MATECDILGITFNNLSREEALGLILLYLEQDETKVVFTANPEIVMFAHENKEFLSVIKSADLIVADGIGVVIASKILKNPLKERVAGYDLVQSIFDKIKNTDKTVYFLGGAPNVANNAKHEMENKYQNLRIVGTNDGYFDEKEGNLLLQEINELKPDLLLVGFGCPKQERWIVDNRESINSKVIIGVGGSFDVMSGNIKRAPKIFIKLGLEWFYRLITQPSRFKRMLKLPLFLLEVFKINLKGEL